ncbi:uroporphyrinogen-III synthase [Rhodospira trueperi]|uniref:Uroporphyrinogen-III synthase n=1 Tax=Rhodospira trueperi TaxID=69960 RepID=A0A1G7DV91_9PROT|nr:uroporphyrinogen-III synthase [Rhodospira trueperi]SDE55409.1 uroporphyrinogen-III synthase [Rhodospira trueperi]
MRALVSRPREDAERIAAPLRAMGVEVVSEPLLVVVPVAGPNVDLTGVQAVLVTSANGARALATAVERRDVPVFAVGDQTARAARDLGFASVESAGGDVETLAALVRRRLEPSRGSLLHAAGSTHAGDLAGALGADGFDVRVARLYDARPTAALSASLRASLDVGGIDAAFFFSPRTARTFVEHIRKAGLADKLGRVTGYALSPAVARELESILPGRVRVAGQPTQDALLDVFKADVADAKEASLKQPQDAENGTPTDRTGAERADGSIDETSAAEDAVSSSSPSEAEAGQDAATSGEDAARPRDDDSADKALDDGDGVYGGSAGHPGSHDDDRGGLSAQEQADSHTLHSLGRWILVLVVLGAIGFGAMPWWRASVPEPLQSWLPTFPAAPDPPAVVDLRARIETLSAALEEVRGQADSAADAADAALDAARSGTAGGASAALEDLSARLAALEERADERAVASAADGTASGEAAQAAKAVLSNIDERLTMLEAATEEQATGLSDLRSRVGALQAEFGSDEPRAVGMVLAVGQLRDRVATGKPYDEALEAVRSLVSGAEFEKELAVLATHSTAGVSTLPELRWRYAEVSKVAAHRVIVPEGEGWWSDTVSSLMSGVTVRRKDEVVAGSALSSLSAAEMRLAENDLETAIDVLSSLEGDPAGAVADWLADAQALASVNAALASLNSAALERVGAAQTTE